jgi:hypothetical protein
MAVAGIVAVVSAQYWAAGIAVEEGVRMAVGFAAAVVALAVE